MPQLQVVDTTRDKPDPTGVAEFFSKLGKDYKDKQDQVEIGNLISQYQDNRQDANAWEDLQLGLEKSNVSPTKRLQTQQSLNEMKKVITERDKALNAKVKQGMLGAEEREAQKQTLIESGMPDYEAEVYVDSPPSVKASIDRAHRELLSRGLRKPLNEQQASKNQEAVPEVGQAPEQAQIEEEEVPAFVDEGETPQEKAAVLDKAPVEKEDWPEAIAPTKMTPAERVKWENNNEKENNKELKETQTKKKAYAQNDILINSMTQVNNSKKLPTGAGKLLIDPSTGDLRPTAQLAGLVNPETQLYVKNLKQWLKGAKDFFGARVTNFDVSSFMAQLPSLLNSEQGRRLILKQMKYVNDLEAIHNNTLNEGLKKYGRNANYNQVVQVVDKKVSEREKDLLGKINNLVQASDYINKFEENQEKFKGQVLMQTPKGQYKAVPKDKVDYLKSKQWRDF